MIDRSVFDAMQVRVRRVSKMSLRELSGRARMEATKWMDRVAPGRWSGEPVALFARRAPSLSGSDAALAAVRDQLPHRFFAGLESESAARSSDDVIALADAILARRFNLLGYRDLQLGTKIDWHRDAVAGVRAPEAHWSAIEPLNPQMVGDSKVTWELSRHQWLVTLAQACQLTQDQKYARQAADLLKDWIDANPYGTGINWSSSLEVAYRLIAWCWAMAMLRESEVFSNDACAVVLSHLWLHAMHVERYLSFYFSPNTHLTGEALGLFYAGVLFPEFDDAARWRDVGRTILIDESARQILDDGVYFEQATCYQRYTIEIYQHFILLAERNGVEVPAEVRQRVESMLDVLLTLRHPDGTMPSIGDADGGWLLPLTPREPNDCRGVFGIGAVMFGRPDFAWAAGGLQPEVAWLLGAPGIARFAAVRPHEPVGPASQHLAAGGYAVMRSGWDRKAHQMIVDAGPLGCPYASAHGHADLLSLQVQAFGESYLVDPGTYCYTGDTTWRNHFRGSSAHSTVVVDGKGQVEPRTAFSWQGRPVVEVTAWRSNANFDLIDARHTGYGRLDDAVTHRRRVLFVKPDFWVVVDDLDGRATHEVELRFQFAPRTVRLGPGGWASSEGSDHTGVWLAPFSSASLSASLRIGQTEPVDGWVSTDYGQRQPAPAVVYATTAMLPLRIVTLVLPVRGVQPQPPAVEAVWGADGAVVGLRLVESAVTIVVDEQSISAQRGQ
jgi:uncharacterized heparinase superfamily protein